MRQVKNPSSYCVDGKPAGSDAQKAVLADLAKRFAQFRKEHRRHTRVPQELREAVLAVVGKVPPGDLYRACGVSFRQVMTWKAAKARSSEAPDVRVFSVVDDKGSAQPHSTGITSAPELELRFGPWTVSVQLTGDATGGAACCR